MEFLIDLWREIIFTIVIAIGVSVFAWVRKKVKNTESNAKEIEKLRKFRWRITKTVIIMAKLIDSQTEKAHEGTVSELEEVVKELLEGEDTTR